MNRSIAIGAGAVAVLAAIIVYLSAFTVSMTQQAIVLQFGDPRAVITEPGLHWKLPVVQNVVYIDKRILNLNAPPEEIIAKDRKRLVVDAFARYKIVDSLRFYQAVGDPRNSDNRLRPNFVSSLRNVLGDHTLEELVRDNRAGLMKKIQTAFDQATRQFGIEVVDVRIRRADLPEQNSQAIYQRMQTEREREAAEIRAQGNEEAQRIRSRADRESTVLIAEAERDGQIARGEGDAKRNEIYADAYTKDPEFFAFYRSMQAYKESMKGENTTMVVTPDSEFFRYFGSEGGRR
ncbi:protease modulator HflC [Parvibaculum sp.]|jgi:membrane protease subunit HflC|uniref:protease modulator HflC n=1 Tax=Parvibaculum sp. TaxID=2024848 RepID=UPI001B0E0E77|nr:protease modulator HflC [Parvibaculum sp.]MBO6635640.1 protease modulator HflC [Parvibaculum sp.]MBO6679781.1 protease modulator HflC [Parvibaculum sp.]MBO6685841.1 protease modulator HflC [Parvibaculum sp.]MBO6904063.1 protease modulator HflC [Parvibaculum sp.]